MGGGCCRAEVPSVEQVVLVDVSLSVCVCVREREVTSETFFFVMCAKCESVVVRVCVLEWWLQLLPSATWTTSGQRCAPREVCERQ